MLGIAPAATARGLLSSGAPRASATTWLTCLPSAEPSTAPASDPNAFPASALRGPVGAENAPDPAAQALRTFLASDAGGFHLPAHSYVALRRTTTQVLYGHVGGAARVDAYVTIANNAGAWTYYNNGGCTPSRVFPGREADTFSVIGPVPPAARSVLIEVQTGSCGPSPRDVPRRLDRVVVAWRRHELVLTPVLYIERSPPGPCAGVGVDFTVRVLLTRALGQHHIYQGVYFPVQPAPEQRGTARLPAASVTVRAKAVVPPGPSQRGS
jgi:hypothetical protein